MRVTIYTETRALLWFAMSNGVAHFYFTLLPYLTHEGTQVNAVLTALSIGLACFWLYGVRVVSSNLLLMWIPCGWLLTYALIVEDRSSLPPLALKEAIDLSVTDPHMLGDRLSLFETLGASVIFGGYRFTGLRWLSVARGRAIDESALSPLYSSPSETQAPPKRWPSFVIIYWLFSAPLAAHFYSALSVSPEILKTSGDLNVWVQTLWLLAALPLVFGASLILFRLRPINEELFVADDDEPHRRWRKFAWLAAPWSVLDHD